MSNAYDAIRVERKSEELGHIALARPDEMNTFSVGADINDGDSDGEDLNRQGVETSQRGQEIFGRLRDSPLPIVAAVDGFALGAGMEFTMCVDLRVASARSEFGLPEHDLGLLPG